MVPVVRLLINGGDQVSTHTFKAQFIRATLTASDWSLRWTHAQQEEMPVGSLGRHVALLERVEWYVFSSASLGR